MIEHVNADEAAAQPALGSFMRLLAHELGNPVATIRMSAEMLQSNVPPEMHEQLSSMILEEAIHLEELIERALFYASIGTPSPVDVDVPRLLESVAQQFPSAPVSIRAAVTTLTLHADPGQLGRMVGEAIANAVDSGATTIELSAEQQNGNIVIRVIDDGEGVGASAASRVFDPFYTTREGKLGLGLTIARRIAALHGGSAEARPGTASGAEVSYSIPINR
ncbi:MAG TPA: ATP-binding protein [Candidatus Kapabacteria bacterium]|nr:ATP-binding protein [Candidatus Kapabacteria bacterium]